jgi:hypothetical protein
MLYQRQWSHAKACHLRSSIFHNQVRQLQALGVRLRKDIMAEVEVASKFYR